MPKVSIVLPTYNGSKYIKESIDSIIYQTYKDWELIIVNDCSIDETSEIIADYVRKDSRIRVINNAENQNLPKSLNIGFRQAVGEYFTWTSDDNYYLDTAIERMVSYLDNNQSFPMLCAEMDVIDENGVFLYKHFKYSTELMFFNNCVGACFMYRKKVINDIGEYDADRFCIEDYEYWMRILKRYGTIGWLDETLYRYRCHKDSLTRTKKNFIRNQLLDYRISEIDWILTSLKGRPELIAQMYCEFIHNKHEAFFYEKACRYVPELLLLNNKTDSEEYIVWGAGNYGQKAIPLAGGKIYKFADKNIKLVGTVIEGVEVISFEQMLNEKKEICIAVSDEKVYWLLSELYKRGIRKCRLIQEFMNEDCADV